MIYGSNASKIAVLLGTVNAPCRRRMNADELASALLNGDIRRAQVGSFFAEVSVEMQKLFAEQYGVPESVLRHAARAFADWSGEEVLLLK